MQRHPSLEVLPSAGHICADKCIEHAIDSKPQQHKRDPGPSKAAFLSPPLRLQAPVDQERYWGCYAGAQKESGYLLCCLNCWEVCAPRAAHQ